MSIPIVTSFEVKKTLLGGYQVFLACPHCASQLHCKEAELGADDSCPECRQPFRVSPQANAQIETLRQQALGKKQQKATGKSQAEGNHLADGGTSPQAVSGKKPPAPETRQRANPASPSRQAASPPTICPSCAEENPVGATKCMHCGDTIGGPKTRRKTAKEKVHSSTAKDRNSDFRIFGYALASGVVLMGLGVLAIPLVIGACCLGMLNTIKDLPKQQNGVDIQAMPSPDEATVEPQPELDDPASQVALPPMPPAGGIGGIPGRFPDERFRPPDITPPRFGHDPRLPADSIDFGVVLEITVEQLAERRVRIHGNTNLPPDTKLLVSLKDRQRRSVSGQSQCAVSKEGEFHSEAVGPPEGLRDGVYVAEVVMPHPREQSESVQRTIGMHGERLWGPRVQQGPAGKLVFVAREFTIGHSGTVETLEARARERVEPVEQWLADVEALHDRLIEARSNKWLSDGADKGKLAKWATFAAVFNQDIQSYQRQLTLLQPMQARTLLSTALESIKAMFHASSLRRDAEYDQASARYAKSIKDLKEFVERNRRSP